MSYKEGSYLKESSLFFFVYMLIKKFQIYINKVINNKLDRKGPKENIMYTMINNNEEMTIGRINGSTTILVEFCVNDVEQFLAAFGELLNNNFIDFNDGFRNPAEAGFYINTPEEAPQEMEAWFIETKNDNYQVIQGLNFELRLWIARNNTNRPCLFTVELEWRPETFGYWTYPGTLVHRCLGQGLPTYIWEEEI